VDGTHKQNGRKDKKQQRGIKKPTALQPERTGQLHQQIKKKKKV
jgi:hypothetical protein